MGAWLQSALAYLSQQGEAYSAIAVFAKVRSASGNVTPTQRPLRRIRTSPDYSRAPKPWVSNEAVSAPPWLCK